MRKIIPTITLCLSMGQSHALQTDDLMSKCSQPEGSMSEGICIGYISGVSDTIDSAGNRNYCPGIPYDIDLMKRVVMTYIDRTRHIDAQSETPPATQKQFASVPVKAALLEAFPCKANQ